MFPPGGGRNIECIRRFRPPRRSRVYAHQEGSRP